MADLSSRRLVEALDHVSVGFCLYDAEKRLVHCNSRHRDFYSPVAVLLVPGQKAEKIFRAMAESKVCFTPQKDVEEWVEFRMENFDRPGEPFELRLMDSRWLRIEYRSTSDGGRVEISTDITQLKDQEQALRFQVIELRDTQERLEIQGARLVDLVEGLAAARDEAERANRTKSEFLANMSHELRSPLNAIIGFAEVMKGELMGELGQPEYKEYTEDIYDCGTHLLEIINDILDLSKIEAGKLGLNEDVFELQSVIKSSQRLVMARARKGAVTLDCKLIDLPTLIVADERKFKQILLNLLSNAVKFTPRGGRVTTKYKVEADGSLLLTVSDTGIGIAEEDLATAMSPFGQVDSSLSRQFEGAGLGLPLTKALVELHGGTLTIESEVGKGTVAIVRLPASRVRAAFPSGKAASPPG